MPRWHATCAFNPLLFLTYCGGSSLYYLNSPVPNETALAVDLIRQHHLIRHRLSGRGVPRPEIHSTRLSCSTLSNCRVKASDASLREMYADPAMTIRSAARRPP